MDDSGSAEALATGKQRRAVLAWGLIAGSVAAANLLGAPGPGSPTNAVVTASLLGSLGTLAALLGITLLVWNRSRGLVALASAGHGQIGAALGMLVQIAAPVLLVHGVASIAVGAALMAGRVALAASIMTYAVRRLRGAPPVGSVDAADAGRRDSLVVWVLTVTAAGAAIAVQMASAHGVNTWQGAALLPVIAAASIVVAGFVVLLATRLRFAADAWVGVLAVSSSATVLPIIVGRPWGWSQAVCLILAEGWVLYDLIGWLSGRFANMSDSLHRVAEEALLDGLTGVPNRRGFDRVFESVAELSRRSKQPFAVALLDIDKFKAYNDEFGHPAGDECLRKIASTIAESCVRPSDIVARYGGEEFAVILPGADTRAAYMVAERIREVVQKQSIPHARASGLAVVTVSIGYCSTDTGARPEHGEMLRLADQALYAAKEAGRNRVQAAPCVLA